MLFEGWGRTGWYHGPLRWSLSCPGTPHEPPLQYTAAVLDETSQRPPGLATLPDRGGARVSRQWHAKATQQRTCDLPRFMPMAADTGIAPPPDTGASMRGYGLASGSLACAGGGGAIRARAGVSLQLSNAPRSAKRMDQGCNSSAGRL